MGYAWPRVFVMGFLFGGFLVSHGQFKTVNVAITIAGSAVLAALAPRLPPAVWLLPLAAALPLLCVLPVALIAERRAHQLMVLMVSAGSFLAAFAFWLFSLSVIDPVVLAFSNVLAPLVHLVGTLVALLLGLGVVALVGRSTPSKEPVRSGLASGG